MSSCQVVIPVSESSQVGEARRAAGRLAEQTTLDENERGKFAIIASELATNLSRHTRGGELLMRTLGQDSKGLEILCIDRGPGMADISRCLEDGFSTGGTTGNGLGAVQRLSDVFDIYSNPLTGTVILSRIGEAASSRRVQWGVVCIAVKGETECGDSWSVIENDPMISVLIADGLGHGPIAAEASSAAVQVFEADASRAPARFLEAAHNALRTTRGAAVAIAQLRINDRELSYAGLGNISGNLQTAGESRGLMSHNGTAGLEVRKIQQFEYPWAQNALMIMHSDGLNTRWDLEKFPGLFQRHPAVIAGLLYRDFSRGRDDVTVLVMR